MLTVPPAFVWRGGAVMRGGVIVGVGTGIFVGLLAWLDSGLWLAAVLAAAIITGGLRDMLGLRMVRYWPAPPP